MDKGQVAAQGPIDELKGPDGPRLRAAHQGRPARRSSTCSQTAGMECHATDEDVMRVFVPRTPARRHRPAAIFSAARAVGVQVRHLRPSVPTLEDVFAKAIGED